MKTPVLESHYNKVTDLHAFIKTLLKKDSNTGVFLWILQNFQKYLFNRTRPKNYYKAIVAYSNAHISKRLRAISHLNKNSVNEYTFVEIHSYLLLIHLHWNPNFHKTNQPIGGKSQQIATPPLFNVKFFMTIYLLAVVCAKVTFHTNLEKF